MTKLDEVKKRLVYYNEWRRGGDGEQPDPKQLGHDIDYAIKALALYRAILEKRVLLVPAQEDENRGRAVQVMADCFKHGWDLNDLTRCMRFYKAMTQAVETENLIEEITNETK